MATPITIQDFLVSLGFKLDQGGLRRFSETLDVTRKNVLIFGAAVSATVIAVEEAIKRIQRSFENLFYLSQRTLTSARDIEGIRAGFRQIGLSAQDADAILTTFGNKLRENPAYQALLGRLTGTTDPGEGLRRLARQHKDIIDRFGEISPQAAANLNRLQQYFNLDPGQFTQIAKNSEALEKAIADFSKLSDRFGVKQDDAAKKAAELGRSVEAIWDRVRLSIQRLVIETFPDLQKAANQFIKWLDSPEFKGVIDELISLIRRLGEEFTAWLQDPDRFDKVKQTLVEIRDAVKGIADFLSNVKDVIEWLSNNKPPEWLEKLLMGRLFGKTAPEVYKERKEQIEGQTGLPFPSQSENYFGLGRRQAREALRKQQEQRRQELQDQQKREFTAPIPLPQSYQGERNSLFKRIGYNSDNDLSLLLRGFARWWSGDSSFHPIVSFAEEVYDKFTDAFRNALGLTPSYAGAGGSQRAGVAGGGRMPGKALPSEGGRVGPGKLSLAQLKQLALNAGFKGDDAAIMAAIVMGESGGDPYAHNKKENSFGLTQIHEGSHGADARKAHGNPTFAMQKAFELYQNRRSRGQRGFEDWSVYNEGKHRPYLDAAKSASLPGRRSTGRFWFDDAFTGGLRNIPGLDPAAQQRALDLFKSEIRLQKSMDGAPLFNAPPLGGEKLSSNSVNNHIESPYSVNYNIHGSEARAIAREVQDVQRRESAIHIRNLRAQVV